MIDVNATVLVQAIHFFVAWWLLDKFFFQFIVKVIQKEEAIIKRLNQSIEQEVVFLSEEETRRGQLWKGYQKKFRQGAPNVEMTPTLSYSAVLCPIWLEMKKDKKERLITTTADLLVERVLSDK